MGDAHKCKMFSGVKMDPNTILRCARGSNSVKGIQPPKLRQIYIFNVTASDQSSVLVRFVRGLVYRLKTLMKRIIL